MKTPNPDDLLVAARRRPLAVSEQRQLQMLADASPEAQLLLAAGKGFDAEGEPQPGDRLLLGRLVAHTVKGRGERNRSRTLRYVLVASVISGAASAAIGVAIVAMPLRDEPASSAPPTEPANLAQSIAIRNANVPLAAPVDAAVPTPASGSPATPSVTTVQCSPLPGVSPDSAPPQPSAATAYADANALRRGRKTKEAIVAYRQILARHPGTAEAQQSVIALGNLLLDTEQSAQALAAFQTYRIGPLGEEAAWGQIRALLALGRTDEAREMLGSLEAAHPASPYVVAARRRLSRSVEPGAPAATSSQSP